MSKSEPPPAAWKFWWPLPFWKALLVFLFTNVAGNLLWAGVSTALDLSNTSLWGGSIGGAAGVVIVMVWAGKLRKKRGQKPT